MARPKSHDLSEVLKFPHTSISISQTLFDSMKRHVEKHPEKYSSAADLAKQAIYQQMLSDRAEDHPFDLEKEVLKRFDAIEQRLDQIEHRKSPD